MTQGQIMAAFPALNSLKKQRISASVSWDIYEMAMACSKIVDFQAAEERKLIEEMDLKADENGFVAFKSKEKRDEFIARMNEIHDVPAEIGLAEIVIDLDDPDNNGIKVSAEEIEQLKGLVSFVKGGKKNV